MNKTLILTGLVGLAGLVPATSEAQEHPWDDSGAQIQGTQYAWNYAMGYHFSPNLDGDITQLGGSFSGTKLVRLFDRAKGAELASAWVTGNNGWSYTSISPVPVEAGREYTVAVYLAGAGGSRSAVPAGGLPADVGSVHIIASTYVSTRSDPWARPTNAATWAGYGVADVGFEAATCAPDQRIRYCADYDGDGFPEGFFCNGGGPMDPNRAPLLLCPGEPVPSNYVRVDGDFDCDDSDNATHPGAIETCDVKDNNCDGVVPPCVTCSSTPHGPPDSSYVYDYDNMYCYMYGVYYDGWGCAEVNIPTSGVDNRGHCQNPSAWVPMAGSTTNCAQGASSSWCWNYVRGPYLPYSEEGSYWELQVNFTQQSVWPAVSGTLWSFGAADGSGGPDLWPFPAGHRSNITKW